MALMMASVTAISLVCLRYPIARLYQEDPAVLSLAVVLLAYTALYQFPDAMQVVTMAVSRGYNDTRAMFGVTFLSYWVISLPLGYVVGLMLGAPGWLSVLCLRIDWVIKSVWCTFRLLKGKWVHNSLKHTAT